MIGGIPLTAHFVLFDFVINNPKSSETATNLALLDIAGGHFSRIEYSSGGRLPGSLIGEFAHIAREYINSTASSQSVTTNHRLRSPNASSNGEATLLEKSSFSPLSRAEAFSTDEHTDGSIESDVHEREVRIEIYCRISSGIPGLNRCRSPSTIYPAPRYHFWTHYTSQSTTTSQHPTAHI